MIIGLDLGGTNIRGAVVDINSIQKIYSQRITSTLPAENVLEEIFSFTDPIIHPSVTGIGIGVPGLADSSGNVYDVINIPSWKEINLRQMMEDRYHLPVKVENDANCFALGEFYFGKGKGLDSMLGLTIGTGLGSGLILNGKLYSGNTGGAGEFGMIDYMDHYVEYYASGQFFQNVYRVDGIDVYENAMNGNKEALQMYQEMGSHLGNAIRMILYALDVEMIVLGGSVSKAFPFFSEAMWQSVNQFAFKRALKNLRIEVSELENAGILGAAALHY